MIAKSMKLNGVMEVVKRCVDFVRTKGLRHRQFKNLLEELDAAHKDVPFYSEVRWLSRGQTLKKAFDVSKEIAEFMSGKGNPVPEFDDEQFMNDFAFAVDLTTKLNMLNISLQGKNKLISDMYHVTAAFDENLEMWIQQVNDGNLRSFPTLSTQPNVDAEQCASYLNILSDLREQFGKRFMDFKEVWEEIVLFSHPRSLKLSEVMVRGVDEELVSLKHNPLLNDCFSTKLVIESYKALNPTEYPHLIDHGIKYSCMFGSTYVCESLFSMMKYIKNKQRTRLTDSHLQALLAVATSSITPNFKNLGRQIQHQKSH